MSVTTAYSSEKKDRLELYRDFLNLDFKSDPRKKLKKGSLLKNFLNQYERGEPNWLESAQALQAEIRNDIFPIAAWKEVPEKLFPYSERWLRLTKKLNEMGFRRRWDQHENQKGRIVIRAWNFMPNMNQRTMWYLGLAQILEDNDFERLRLCPICKKYFVATHLNLKTCRMSSCRKKYRDMNTKLRVSRWRVKQKRNKQEQETKRQYDRKVEYFFEFLAHAQANSQDTKYVGPMVRSLGQGDPKRIWKIFDQCEDKLKQGIPPHQVFKELPQEIKEKWL